MWQSILKWKIFVSKYFPKMFILSHTQDSRQTNLNIWLVRFDLILSQYPRIDTRQLDLQIKSIMQEVIPYLKEHMDDVCSTQLLAYIRRLVMNLARQRDDSREFVRFFNRQLGSILEDSLSKFSGRK